MTDEEVLKQIRAIDNPAELLRRIVRLNEDSSIPGCDPYFREFHSAIMETAEEICKRYKEIPKAGPEWNRHTNSAIMGKGFVCQDCGADYNYFFNFCPDCGRKHTPIDKSFFYPLGIPVSKCLEKRFETPEVALERGVKNIKYCEICKAYHASAEGLPTLEQQIKELWAEKGLKVTEISVQPIEGGYLGGFLWKISAEERKKDKA